MLAAKEVIDDMAMYYTRHEEDDPKPTERKPRPRALTPLQEDDADEACNKLNVEVLRARAAMLAGDPKAATAALLACHGLLFELARAGRDIGVCAPFDLEKLELCITLDAVVGGPGDAIPEMPPTTGLDVWAHAGHITLGGREANVWIRPKP